MLQVRQKPWSVEDFDLYRPHMTKFIRKNMRNMDKSDYHLMIIRAPVKSGKREMVEYAAMRDNNNHDRVHAFISSFHRAADEFQREELGCHNLNVFSLYNKENVNKVVKFVVDNQRESKKIILHIDECDFGSGKRQNLAEIWKLRETYKNLYYILYSATPEEAFFTGEIEGEEEKENENLYLQMIDKIRDEAVIREYNPPEGYCGAVKFIEEGLVSNAMPFFEHVSEHISEHVSEHISEGQEKSGLFISKQGKRIIRDLRENMKVDRDRNIIILRLSYGKKSEKAISKFCNNIQNFPELQDFDIVVDKDSADKTFKTSKFYSKVKIEWSDQKFWDRYASKKPALIIIDQTSTRSTEWSCHDRVFALHDFRPTVVYSTVSQAQERVNHYSQKYGGKFQRIFVFGHKKTFLLSARKISYNEFLTNEWRTRKITNSDCLYLVKDKDGNPHESCGEGLSRDRADRLMYKLGCYDMSVSARVASYKKEQLKCTSEFIACRTDDPESEWPSIWSKWKKSNSKAHTPFKLKDIPAKSDNPFAESRKSKDGKWRGYRREWGIFDYDNDIFTKPGWGVGKTGVRKIICYKDGELGVAFCWCIGVQHISRLETYNSMYKW
jgi:hypothetical protein